MASRRDVRWWEAERRAPIRPLLDALSFTTSQPNGGMALRRGSFRITGEDFGRIAEAMAARVP